MAVTLVTVVNAVATASAGFEGTIVDVCARVSGGNTNCLVAIYHGALTAQSASWDVCGASPQAMTTAGEIGIGGTGGNLKVFQLLNPTAGKHVLRAYVSGTASNRTLAAYALTGVADSTPIGALVAQTGTTDNLSANVVSTANEIVIDAAFFAQAADVSALGIASVGPGQTETYNRRPLNNITFAALGSYQTGETSTRMSWDEDFGTLANWGHVAFNVVATAEGGASGKTSLMSLGMGT